MSAPQAVEVVCPWVQTRGGVKFPLLDPSPEHVRLEDVAHGLAHICRFAGNTKAFYSVAQHSVLAARLAFKLSGSLPIARTALFHDASEAYTGDVPAPLKRWLNEVSRGAFSSLEERIMEAAAAALRFEWPECATVEYVDRALCATEGRDLLGAQVAPWGLGVDPLADLTICPWTPDEAYVEFRLEEEHTR